MAKPSVLPGNPRRVTVTTQAHIAQAEVALKIWHLGQPWACWIALTVAGLGLRLGFAHLRPESAVLAGVAGVVIAALDYHLRSHRVHLVARAIGPVTVLLATMSLVVFILRGFSTGLTLIYIVGGGLACVIWDIWLAAGEHRDLTRAFMPAGNEHLGGAFLSGLTKHKRHLSATMHLQGGNTTLAEAASQLARVEGAMGHPPGSWSLAPDARNAGLAHVRISDPELINRAPLPWTGPSHPGESIALPILPGMWQDGVPVAYCIPGHHLLGMGATGSGKSESWAWGQIGEGITRHDYACIAADITKGGQIFGPLRPALHALATTPEEAWAQIAAIHQMIRARADYLTAHKLTEWQPGCGLPFVDIFWEEAPDIVALLGNGAALQVWKSDVRALRTMGGRWNLSTQRTDFKEIPTLARGQMARICFGVIDAEDARFGLTEEQRNRGVKPQLWGVKYPGKCVLDAPSIPDDRIALPWRWWYWEGRAEQVAAYAAEWPIAKRPVDDVTGEALFNSAPPPSPSAAFPAPALHLVDGDGNAQGTPRAVKGPPAPLKRMKMDDAVAVVREQVEDWRADGRKTFRVRDLKPLLGEAVDRSRSWLYDVLKVLETEEPPILKRVPYGRPTQWKILDRDEETP